VSHSPLGVVALAALLLAALLGVRIAVAGGPSGLVVAGDASVHPDRPADLAVVHKDSTGYDGQFVYRLALDPFTRAGTAYGITLDNPPYRQQRVGLPLAAWAVAKTGLPLSVALLLVNALALLAAAWAGAVLAVRLGRDARWGLLVAFSPALVIGVARDLTEPLTTALLLLGLVAWTAPRAAPRAAVRTALLGTVAFTAAVLTRETTLAVLSGLGLYEVWTLLRDPAHRAAALARAALLLVPLAAYLGWQAHLRHVWGRLPLAATDGDVGLPILHTLRSLPLGGGAWADWASKDALQAHAWVVERFLLAALLVVVAWALRRSRLHPALKYGWVVGALLALTATWGRDVAFLRAANEAVVLGLLVLLGTRARAATYVLAGVAGLSLYVAVAYGVVL
jgi:hypothetical protein